MTTPKKMFLLDGLGALLSIFLLGFVLVRFQSIIGMPPNVLYFLAFLPCLFALYDLYCYLKVEENWRPFLKGIAYANAVYCLISIVSLFLHFQHLTNLGITYFVLELIVLFILIYIEFKIATE